MVITYKVHLANNLSTLYPHLPKECEVEVDSALTIVEIAKRTGIPSLLLVGGIIEEALYSPEDLIKKDASIVLLGPIAGG